MNMICCTLQKRFRSFFKILDDCQNSILVLKEIQIYYNLLNKVENVKIENMIHSKIEYGNYQEINSSLHLDPNQFGLHFSHFKNFLDQLLKTRGKRFNWKTFIWHTKKHLPFKMDSIMIPIPDKVRCAAISFITLKPIYKFNIWLQFKIDGKHYYQIAKQYQPVRLEENVSFCFSDLNLNNQFNKIYIELKQNKTSTILFSIDYSITCQRLDNQDETYFELKLLTNQRKFICGLMPNQNNVACFLTKIIDNMNYLSSNFPQIETQKKNSKIFFTIKNETKLIIDEIPTENLNNNETDICFMFGYFLADNQTHLLITFNGKDKIMTVDGVSKAKSNNLTHHPNSSLKVFENQIVCLRKMMSKESRIT